MNNVTNPPWTVEERMDDCIITAPTDALTVRYVVARGLTRADARFVVSIWDLARALNAAIPELEYRALDTPPDMEARSFAVLEQAYNALEAVKALDGVEGLLTEHSESDGPLAEDLDPRRGEPPIVDNE